MWSIGAWRDAPHHMDGPSQALATDARMLQHLQQESCARGNAYSASETIWPPQRPGAWDQLSRPETPCSNRLQQESVLALPRCAQVPSRRRQPEERRPSAGLLSCTGRKNLWRDSGCPLVGLPAPLLFHRGATTSFLRGEPGQPPRSFRRGMRNGRKPAEMNRSRLNHPRSAACSPDRNLETLP